MRVCIIASSEPLPAAGFHVRLLPSPGCRNHLGSADLRDHAVTGLLAPHGLEPSQYLLATVPSQKMRMIVSAMGSVAGVAG